MESNEVENLNARSLNLITFLVGLVLVLVGVLVNIENPIGIVLISIGTSILASSIVVYLSIKYLFKQNKIKQIIEQWGLSGIYRTRADMNESSNEELLKASDCLDIIAFGLKGFRERQSELLKRKVKKGIRIRIISIQPNSVYLKQREINENEIEGQIANTINNLYDWVKDLQTNQLYADQIELKFYDSLPLDFYFRIDKKLFIGPYLLGMSSQQTISYEFHINSQGFDYYTNYFDNLWSNDVFLKRVL